MQPVMQLHVHLSFIQHQKSLTWFCFSRFKLNSYPPWRFYTKHKCKSPASSGSRIRTYVLQLMGLTCIHCIYPALLCNCHLFLCTSWSQLASAPSNLPCTPDLVGTWHSAVEHLCVLRSDALSSPLNWICIPTSNMIYEAVRNGTTSFDTHWTYKLLNSSLSQATM